MELNRDKTEQRDCTCGMRRSNKDREVVSRPFVKFALQPLPTDAPGTPQEAVVLRACCVCWQVYVVR
jgi:hypothetical protein